MSIRTVNFVLDDDGNMMPATIVSGVQYEEKATAVEYTVSDTFVEKILEECSAESLDFRIDFDTDEFGYNPSGSISRADEKVVRVIPRPVAESRECRVNLVITAISGGEALAVINSPQSRIIFSPIVRTDTAAFVETLPDLSSFTAFIEGLKDEVENDKNSVSEMRGAVSNDKQLVNQMAQTVRSDRQTVFTAKNSCMEYEHNISRMETRVREYYNRIMDIVLPEHVLPDVTSADNGKFLRVVNASWRAVRLSDGSEEEF